MKRSKHEISSSSSKFLMPKFLKFFTSSSNRKSLNIHSLRKSLSPKLKNHISFKISLTFLFFDIKVRSKLKSRKEKKTKKSKLVDLKYSSF